MWLKILNHFLACVSDSESYLKVKAKSGIFFQM